MATSFRGAGSIFTPSSTPTAPATTTTTRAGNPIFTGTPTTNTAPDVPNGGVVNPSVNTGNAGNTTATTRNGNPIFAPTTNNTTVPSSSGGYTVNQFGGMVYGTPSTSTSSTTAKPNAPPVTPTFAPTTYTQSSVNGFPSGYTSSTPTLSSYLQNQVATLFNPSSIENGSASPDPTQYLTSLANNYLQLNPNAGSQADISQLVNQYAGMYNTWRNQYNQYLQANSGNIALPAGSPYAAPGSAAANTPGPVNAYATPSGGASPYTPYTTPAPVISNTTGSTNNLSISQILDQLMGGTGAGTAGQASTSVPASNVVTTPLGYTQYQPNTSTQSSQTSSDQLTQLILSLLMGQSGTTPSQTTFSQLLNALGGGNTTQSSGQVNV